MRSLFFLFSAIVVAFLAIDAAAFDGVYRHIVWSEARYDTRMAQYTVERYLSSYKENAIPSR
jgi:hypothetical protein